MNMPILPQTIQVADKQTSLIQYKSVPVMTTEQDTCSWMREVIAKALLAEDAKYERMARARNRSKCTSGTLVHQKESPVGATTEPDVQSEMNQ